MNNDVSTPARARLSRALRKGVIDAYDHLGYVVVVTLATFALTSVVASLTALVVRSVGGAPNIVILALMLPALLLAYLGAVGVYYYVNKSVYREHPAVLETVVGIRLLFKPALTLFVIDFAITAVLAADIAFFLQLFSKSHNIVFAGLAILMGYVSIIWMIMFMYHLPLLIAQLSIESGTGARVILRKSFLLTADNPGFTVGLFLVIIAFAVLCAIPMFVGIAVLFLGASAFLITHALRELFVKYGIVEEDPEVLVDGWPTGTDLHFGKFGEGCGRQGVGEDKET
ncbi:MAG: hypothetical protein ACYC64_12980 [Armatimonadota bacterium]